MALFVPILGPLSGSIGASTFSRNRFGSYARLRVTPVNTNTPPQQLSREVFTFVTINWSSLTEAQRATWIAYADQTPVLNSQGASIILTGAQWFMKVNALRLAAVLPLRTVAPTNPGVATIPIPNQAAVPPALRISDLTSAVPNNLIVNAGAWTTYGPTNVNAALFLYIGNPINPGVAFYRTPVRLLRPPILGAAIPPAIVNYPLPVTVVAGQRFVVQFRKLSGEAVAADASKVSAKSQIIVTAINIP
jgi:hypothetical protein